MKGRTTLDQLLKEVTLTHLLHEIKARTETLAGAKYSMLVFARKEKNKNQNFRRDKVFEAHLLLEKHQHQKNHQKPCNQKK